MSIPECGKEFMVENCPNIDRVAPSDDGSGCGQCSGELLVLETTPDRNKKRRGEERSAAFLRITSFQFVKTTLYTDHENDNKFFLFRKFGKVFMYTIFFKNRNVIFIYSGPFPSLSSSACQIFPGIGSSFPSQRPKYLS